MHQPIDQQEESSATMNPHSGWDGNDRRQPIELPPRQGVKFDGTINLGHVLTFVGFMVTGFTAWTSMDKRVVILEEGRAQQKLIDQAQDSKSEQAFAQVRDALNRIERMVERMSERTPFKDR